MTYIKISVPRNNTAITLLGITEEDFKGNPQVEWEKGHFYEGGWLALVPKMATIMHQL